MNFSEIKQVYCLGIGGAGVSGLARLLKAQGKQVSGSDVAETAITKALRAEGIVVAVPQAASNVPAKADLFVYSDAVPADNIERQAIRSLRLNQKKCTYFHALGEFMSLFHQRIAVSGTHGKTTTTAMLTLVLEAAGLDPTALIGSTVPVLNSNIRTSANNEYCVIEACEHNAHMLELCPNAIVLTNIEADHLDYYRNLAHIQDTFQTYVNKLPTNGVFVQNIDDPGSAMIHYSGKTITYGLNRRAHIRAHTILKYKNVQHFTVNGTTYELNVPGDFNVYNALAVISYATAIGVTPDKIYEGLKRFTGTARRFEVVGTYHDALVISDYAHHPTAIRNLLKATKERYPQQRIVMVFQPHQHNRTLKLFDQFIDAFHNVDILIIQEIFDVVGREEQSDQAISSNDLVQAIPSSEQQVFYSAKHINTKQLLAEQVRANDIVLIVGAGDIYTIAEELCLTNYQQ
ncbi:MAG: UDP-N-acetylmuramate--L-alanine ligase [Patescibacteria group bacterium]|jgi:UDP-N-acetylmuramate--alanine ligase